MMPLRSLRIHRPARGLLVLSLVAAVAAGCGSSRGAKALSATTSSLRAGSQQLTVTPSSALGPNQRVHLSASGFSPDQALVVTECAAKGNATGPGDCNLAGIVSVSSDAGGRVNTNFMVMKGPFGANHIVCGPQQPCLVSVSQAQPNPTQEADAPISFR